MKITFLLEVLITIATGIPIAIIILSTIQIERNKSKMEAISVIKNSPTIKKIYNNLK